MIILKGQVTHTTHSYTNTLKKKEKKLVEKDSIRKLSMPVLNNGNPEKDMVLINLQFLFINKN